MVKKSGSEIKYILNWKYRIAIIFYAEYGLFWEGWFLTSISDLGECSKLKIITFLNVVGNTFSSINFCQKFRASN